MRRKISISLLAIVGLVAALLGNVAATSSQPDVPTSALSPVSTTGETVSAEPPSSPPQVKTDPRQLPSDLGNEIQHARTANSVTFRIPDGSWTSIIDASPLHYQDAQGNWQPIDPAFEASSDGFTVQRNGLRSRAGGQAAWLAVGAGEAALNWQATELGLADADGIFTPFARVAQNATTELRDDNHRLRYTGGWTSAAIAEELASAPNSIEHLTVLSRRPDLSESASPQYLELRATLKLNKGSSLWADSRQQTGAFRTLGTLEIHDETGRAQLVLKPARAYQEASENMAVAGEYVAQPGDKSGEWIVGVRTPWAWWADPARQYPAVIDPEMVVLQSTGFGTGMAWVANGSPNIVADDAKDQNLHFDELVLGSFYTTTAYRGYVQFNSIPYLLTNAPISVSAAYLDVTPASRLRPGYDDSPTDWKKQNMQWPAHVYAMGQCPGQCNGFSLAGGQPSFTWSTSPNPSNSVMTEMNAAPGSSKVLAVKAPDSKGGTGQTTSWDVTDAIRAWNLHKPRPADGPMFMLVIDSNCTINAGYPDSNRMNIRLASGYAGDVSKLNPNYVLQSPYATWLYLYLGVGQCTRVNIQPTGVRLRIQYTSPTLPLGNNWLNAPGIPSSDAAFDNDTTYHEYDLGSPPSPSWLGVAVRSNHAITPALPAHLSLDLYGPNNQSLASDGGTDKDQTLFALIDAHNSTALNASLHAQVQPSAENDFANDGNRNYRIQYEQASAIPTSYGVTVTGKLFIPSTDLLQLKELALVQGDNTQITIQVPEPFTQSISFALARPTSGGLDQAVRSPENNKDGLLSPKSEAISGTTKISSLTFPASVGGNWGLAFINERRPLGPLTPRGTGQFITVTYSILRCPEGAIPTMKWGCQPVILPRTSVYPPHTTTTPMTTALGLNIYSEGGFAVTNSTRWCTRNEGQGTPIIGPGVSGRWVAVGQGSICLNGSILTTTTDSGLFLTIQTGVPITDVKGQFMPGFIYGDTALSPVPIGNPTGVVTRSAFFGDITLAPGADTRRTLQPFVQWQDSHISLLDYIDMTGMEAAGFSQVNVPVMADTSADAMTTTWTVGWSLYPAPTSPPDLPYVFAPVASQSPTFTLPITVSTAQVRILGAKYGAAETTDFWKTETGPDVEFFHAATAKITLDDSLGGASKNVQVVVQPPGKVRKLDKSNQSCGAARSCIDLRRDDYTWQGGQGENNLQMWELPDVHINSQASTVMFSQAGRLNVFGNKPNSTSDVSVPFSFDTWDAVVTVRQGMCNGTETTIIEGTGKIALPMLGNDGGSGDKPIDVNFSLCKTALRSALLSFDASKANLPGIPVGSTGLEVYLLSGQVQVIDQANTEITLQVGFRSVGSYPLNKGTGTITIDTGGFFQIDGSAQVVSYFDADFKLAVAWNPLDVLLAGDMSCCDDLINGGIKLHAWIGQGWQHKYKWLPDNGDQHFTGSVNAQLRVPTGYVVDDWPFVLPPFQVGYGVEMAFGEFCANGACSGYAWGMSAAVEVFGYDVGVYVDSGGPSLFLGSNDHELIDEAGGALAMDQTTGAVAPADEVGVESVSSTGDESPVYETTPHKWGLAGSSQRSVAAQSFNSALSPNQPDLVIGNWLKFLPKPWKTPVTGWTQLSAQSAGCQINGLTHTCPFTVTAGAGRAMFVTSWQNGSLDVALIKPDGTIITPGNATTNGVSVTQVYSPSLKQLTYAVHAAAGATIPSGVWKLRLNNITPSCPTCLNLPNNYRLMFVSDPAAPTIVWQSPLGDVTPDVSGIVNLQWQAVRPGKPLTEATKIELFYVPFDQQPITPTAFAGTLLTNRYTATLGTYPWDTRGLASGKYSIGARIDDHLNGNGAVVAWAPGHVIISDTTPPPAPTLVFTSFLTLKDALIIGWQADLTTPDLAGYIISYTIPSWDVNAPPLTRIRRLNPSPESVLLKIPFMPPLERARLGGLLGGTSTTICVRAYDASGNVSDCTLYYTRVAPVSSDPRLAPVEGLIAQRVVGRAASGIELNWRPPHASTPAGYLVDWRLAACKLPNATVVADQRTPPVYIGNVTTYTLTGLTSAQMYHFDVSAVSPEGYVGPVTSTQAMFFSSLDDANHDGIPDQWADVFGLSSTDVLTTSDPDHDGLINLREYELGSFPNQYDSNGDGFSDGEAAGFGLDPCGPESPPYHARSRPALVSSSLWKFTSFVNKPKPNPQLMTITDFGSGQMDWTVDTSAPWITLSASRGSGPSNVLIGADATGLAVGHYTGVITFTSTSASAALAPASTSDQATLEVALDVLPPQEFDLYLPLVRR